MKRTLLAVLIILAFTPLLASASVMPRDLEDYCVIADKRLTLGINSAVLGGSAGVNRPSPRASKILMTMRSYSIVDPDYPTVASSIKMNTYATVGELFRNFLTTSGPVNIDVEHDGAFPILTLPELPFFLPEDIHVVPQEGTTWLGPGQYGFLEVGPGATVILTGGEYHFLQTWFRSGSQLYYENPVDVRVQGKFMGDEGIVMRSALWADVLPHEVRFAIGGPMVTFGPLGSYEGLFYAPRSTVRVQRQTTITGQVVGKKVRFSDNARCIWAAAEIAPTPIPTLQPTATPSPTPTRTPSPTPTRTPTPTPLATPTRTPTPTVTPSPTPGPTSSPSPTPTMTSTPVPTATPSPTPTSVQTPICVDNDNDEYCAGSGPSKDCNDSNASVNPGAIELCNNIDDNCRGGTDEEFPGKGDACWRKIGSTCWRGESRCAQAAGGGGNTIQCLPLAIESDSTKCN